jgi:hypothetical protein
MAINATSQDLAYGGRVADPSDPPGARRTDGPGDLQRRYEQEQNDVAYGGRIIDAGGRPTSNPGDFYRRPSRNY